MAFRPVSWLQRRARARARAFWAEAAGGGGDDLKPGRLRALREEARATRGLLDRFLMQSDGLAQRARAGLEALPLPVGTDWRWRSGSFDAPLTPFGMARPKSGQRLGADTALWHDCPDRALVLRQIVNERATDLAPFGLRLEVFSFAGSFLSLACDLPDDALNGLSRSHVLRVETLIRPEYEMNIYVRLNIGHGPNTEEELRHLGGVQPRSLNHHVTEFDLAYTDINEARLHKIWVDLIFASPQMNAVDLRDMHVSRHLRAEL